MCARVTNSRRSSKIIKRPIDNGKINDDEKPKSPDDYYFHTYRILHFIKVKRVSVAERRRIISLCKSYSIIIIMIIILMRVSKNDLVHTYNVHIVPRYLRSVCIPTHDFHTAPMVLRSISASVNIAYRLDNNIVIVY